MARRTRSKPTATAPIAATALIQAKSVRPRPVLAMATGQALHACPESNQAKALAVQVLGAQGLGLIAHTYGMGSDTPDSDRQSASERMALGSAISSAASGSWKPQPCSARFRRCWTTNPGAICAG